MKKILIPTDFSATAINAVKYALELFKYDKSEITILHTYADEVYENTTNKPRDVFQDYKNRVKHNVDKKLKNEIEEMLELSPNPRHKYNYKSQFGSLIDVIDEFVNEHNIDVIVMGTKGQTNNPFLTFGSNAIKVMKYSQCPVLVVPNTFHDLHPENILFPTDYLIPYKRRELKLLSSLAVSFVSNIDVLYVSKSKKITHRQEDNQQFLQESFTSNKVNFLQVHDDNVTETINKTIKEQAIDLLVMVNQRHSYLENLLYHSTIEKIGLTIKIPFLVFQNLNR